MECFRKLGLAFDVSGMQTNADHLDMIDEYATPQKYGIALQRSVDFISVPNATYQLLSEDKERILRNLPQSLLNVEIPEVWVLNIKPTQSEDLTMLSPHVDKVRKCCVNIYIDPHGERTAYYGYRAGKLTEIASFIAKDGECWALDSDTPHSVQLSPPHVRRAISISFIKTPYADVVAHFS
jgi:hypothetical protein